MKEHKKKVLVVSIAVALITVAHYLTSSDISFLHDLFRRLYYLPIIYAAFTLGTKGSVLTAAAVSSLYLPHVLHRWSEIPTQRYDALFEIILYFLVAMITSTLVEAEKKRKAEIAELREEMAVLISKAISSKEAKPVKFAEKIAYKFDTMVGQSPEIQKIYDLIEKTGASTINILITGESGTGKELVAKALHNLSDRKNKPFVAINCTAIPETLLESELFGYKKGAFTGALKDKPGKFELADGGTIFLDEIGTMKGELQVKLLRVIQEKEVHSLGDTVVKSVDVRIISATNSDLQEKIKTQEFREDLFYRINVISIDLPPLRKRKKDIPMLVEHFIQKYGCEKCGISKETLKILENHDWPGNIRELENVIQRAVALSKGQTFLPEHLPSTVKDAKTKIAGQTIEIPDTGLNIEALEKDLVRKALQKSKGNQTKAAKLLGLTRATLIYRLEKYGLR